MLKALVCYKKQSNEMLEMKTEIKNYFDRLLSRFETAKKRISELESRRIETTETEIQRGKRCLKK